MFGSRHQDILIQSVENNLMIILCKNGDFLLNLSKVIRFSSFSESLRKSGVVNSISEKKKKRRNFFHDASE